MCDCKKATVTHEENNIYEIYSVETDHFVVNVSEKLTFSERSNSHISSEDGGKISHTCAHGQEIIFDEALDTIKTFCEISKSIAIVINYLKKLGYTIIYKIGKKIGGFTKFVFPVLRQVFPNLIAHDLVSVQPMNAPIGAIFYLEYLYGNKK